MCLEHGGKVFVNGLHDFYIPGNTKHGAIDAAYSRYAKLADDALSSQLPENVKDKWNWFRAYLDSESQEGMQWTNT